MKAVKRYKLPVISPGVVRSSMVTIVNNVVFCIWKLLRGENLQDYILKGFAVLL